MNKKQIRQKFRQEVFKRDNFKCVIKGCTESATDAHHIIDRSLWPDGGYYIDNGASLCPKHHLEAEEGTISCDEIRNMAGIKKVLLPPNFDSSQTYDKWGKVLPS